MTREEVLQKMKESEAAVERGPGHIKVTYTYPLKLSAANPGNHTQAQCYRESTDALQVGVHTNNMKYAKDNYAATGQKVTKCPNGFDYPTDKEEQGYFWIHRSDGQPYIRAKFESIAPEYKQRNKYYIDGQEVDYSDIVAGYNAGEFDKSAIYQVTDKDLFDRHVSVNRVTDIEIVGKKRNIADEEEEEVLETPVTDTNEIEGRENIEDMPVENECLEEEIEDRGWRSNILKFDNGDYFYVVKDGNKLQAGGATNTGFHPEFEIDWDDNISDDENISNLYDKMIEERPELIGEGMNECSNTNLKEDYGWEIPTDKVWEYFDEMEREIGTEELLQSLAKAMTADELADNLAYIARQYDLDYLFNDKAEVITDTNFDDEYTGLE